MIIYIDWEPEGRTVNQVYYKNVLKTFRERLRRGRPDFWVNASRIHNQDKSASAVKRYMAKNNVPAMEHHRATSFSSKNAKGTKFEFVDTE